MGIEYHFFDFNRRYYNELGIRHKLLWISIVIFQDVSAELVVAIPKELRYIWIY